MFKKQISKAAMRLMVQKGKMSLRRMEKASENPMEQNRALLMKILQANRDTEFGREHDFGGIRTIEDFKNNVPAANYEDYAPMLERMKNGEKNLAIHPNCGTNIAVTGLCTAAASMLALLGESEEDSKFSRFSALTSAGLVGALISRPLGPKVQKHITTDPDMTGLSIVSISCNSVHGTPVFFVHTSLD